MPKSLPTVADLVVSQDEAIGLRREADGTDRSQVVDTGRRRAPERPVDAPTVAASPGCAWGIAGCRRSGFAGSGDDRRVSRFFRMFEAGRHIEDGACVLVPIVHGDGRSLNGSSPSTKPARAWRPMWPGRATPRAAPPPLSGACCRWRPGDRLPAAPGRPDSPPSPCPTPSPRPRKRAGRTVALCNASNGDNPAPTNSSSSR